MVVLLPAPFGPRNPVTRPGHDIERQTVDRKRRAVALGQARASIMPDTPSTGPLTKSKPEESTLRRTISHPRPERSAGSQTTRQVPIRCTLTSRFCERSVVVFCAANREPRCASPTSGTRASDSIPPCLR